MKIEEVFARRRFIMLDGAMGTQLQLRGLTTEQKPELAAFIMPDVLTSTGTMPAPGRISCWQTPLAPTLVN